MQKKSVKAVGAACIALAAGLGCGGDGGRVLPPQARWHNNQGVVYMDQHNYVRGREHFEEAARLAPGYATARANLGIALYSLGKYDSARVAPGPGPGARRRSPARPLHPGPHRPRPGS